MAEVLEALGEHAKVGVMSPFKPGLMDCTFWVCDWIKLRTGKDPANRWRGLLSTNLQCARAIKAEGDLLQMADKIALELKLQSISPSEAQPGDVGVALANAGKSRIVQVLVIRGRIGWMAKINNGLTINSRTEVLAAWRL